MAKSKGTQLRRLDAELVKRKIARSREHAREMILDGRVSVNGMEAKKPATGVDGEVSIRVTESDDDRWASRGAHKLLGALAAFEPQGLDLAGTRVLDAGASTGGFTDVCLDRGVSEVLAVDGGYGQLIWRLQNDPRVKCSTGPMSEPSPRNSWTDRRTPWSVTCRSSPSNWCFLHWRPVSVTAVACCRWSSPSSRWARTGWGTVGWSVHRSCVPK